MLPPVSPDDEDDTGARSSGYRSIGEEITEEVLNPKVLEEEGEEALKAKGAVVPELPSREEVEAHMLTHTPYRSWCRRCVKGKAKGKPHFRGTGEEKDVPCVL